MTCLFVYEIDGNYFIHLLGSRSFIFSFSVDKNLLIDLSTSMWSRGTSEFCSVSVHFGHLFFLTRRLRCEIMVYFRGCDSSWCVSPITPIRIHILCNLFEALVSFTTKDDGRYLMKLILHIDVQVHLLLVVTRQLEFVRSSDSVPFQISWLSNTYRNRRTVTDRNDDEAVIVNFIATELVSAPLRIDANPTRTFRDYSANSHRQPEPKTAAKRTGTAHANLISNVTQGRPKVLYNILLVMAVEKEQKRTGICCGNFSTQNSHISKTSPRIQHSKIIEPTTTNLVQHIELQIPTEWWYSTDPTTMFDQLRVNLILLHSLMDLIMQSQESNRKYRSTHTRCNPC